MFSVVLEDGPRPESGHADTSVMTSDVHLRVRGRRLILLAVCGLGISAVMTQLALMREMLSAFAGNELALGVILGNWFLLTGAGTWLGRKADRFREPIRVLVWLQVLVALLPLAQVFLLRTLRDRIFFRGTAIGITETVASSFLLLLPYCVVSGFMLTLACGVQRLIAAADPGRLGNEIHQPRSAVSNPSELPHVGGAVGRAEATDIGRIYIADSVGSIVGGGLFSFVLLPWFDHFGLLCLPGLLNLGLAAVVAWQCGKHALAGLTVGLGVGLAGLMLWTDVDAFSTALQFPQQRIVFRGNSPYGRLVVTESGGQLNFIENGVPVLSSHNTEQVEEAVHYAMAQRPHAHKVLLVSGGISGTAQEILKYGVDQVTYVELDPLILIVGQRYLPDRLADARIQVVNADGRRFIKQTDQRYDVAIVDVPDPSTSQLNRFYTTEFFAEVKRVLAKDGVLSFALGHYENYVSIGLARLLSSAHATLLGSFSRVVTVPGGRVFFLASDGPLYADVAGRMEERGISTRLMTRHYLEAMLSPDRLADLQRATAQPAALNTDFSPVLYYYHLRHWMSQFKVRFGLLGGVLLGVLGLYLAKLRAVPLVLFASGFAASTLEVVLLLAFQVLYGSLYQQMGLIVTLFMAGLAVGALLGNRRLGRAPPPTQATCLPVVGDPASGAEGRLGTARTLAYLAWAIALFAVLLPLLLRQLNQLEGATAFSPVVQAVIPLLTFVLATLVGMEFPLANQVEFGNAATTASKLYTADFVGACLGALLTSALLIPLLGASAACLLAAGLNAAGGAAVLWRRASR
jgi:spermidine synthase